MPIVNMPDGTPVRFPDDMPKEQIKSMIATKYPDFAKQFEKPKVAEGWSGFGQTIADQAAQGVSSGFADELFGLVDKALGVPKEVTEQRQKLYREKLKSQIEERPAASVISNIAGSIANPVTGAALKYASAGSKAAQIAKGALVGAGTGALYGAGSSGPGSRLEGAVTGGATGLVLGGAIPGVIYGAPVAKSAVKEGSENLLAGISARGSEELASAVDEIHNAANLSYKAARDTGAVFKPHVSDRILGRIQKDLKKTGIFGAEFHPKTVSALSGLQERIASGNVGLDDIDQYRKLLSGVVRDNTDIAGKITEDGMKAQVAIDAIDTVVKHLNAKDIASGNIEAVKSLRNARQQWAKYRKMDTLTELVRRAENAGGSADNYKTQFRNFFNSRKKTSGFTESELNLLKKAATNTKPEEMLKWLGKWGIGMNSNLMPSVAGLGASAGYAAGSTAAAPIAGGLVAAGTAARPLRNIVAKGKIEKLIKAVQDGK